MPVPEEHCIAHFLVTLAAVRTAHNARGGGGRHAALNGHPEAIAAAHSLDERGGGGGAATDAADSASVAAAASAEDGPVGLVRRVAAQVPAGEQTGMRNP